jgi:signal transduction histidine kinase
MRSLLLELRPTALEEAALPDLLQQLAESVGGRTGIQVNTSSDISCDIPVSVKVAMYRIAQEALNNIMKHARASLVEIELSSCDERTVLLEVRDNGRGFEISDVPADRLGLSNMRERAQSIGGTLLVESQPEQGTVVSIEWRAPI